MLNVPQSMRRRLDRKLNRRPGRYATRMLGGAHRPNWLRIACHALTQYIRLAERMAKREPHLFGPKAREYFLETLRMEKDQQEWDQAFERIYGKSAQPHCSTLWQDRYPELLPAGPEFQTPCGKEQVKLW